MEEDVPSWINKDYLENIFQKSENDDALRVIEVAIKRATSKGDNYTSDMFRITLELIHGRGKQKETKSIILKLAPTKDGLHKDFVTNAGLFDTEISMMTDTLKKMNSLLGDSRTLSAKAIYTQMNDPSLLILEDLASLGYRMASRHDGLDLDHSILAIHGLAKFHASSVALYEKDPSIKTKYVVGMFHATNEQMAEQMKMFLKNSAKNLSTEIATWPEPIKKYAEKIGNLAEYFYELGMKMTKVDPDEFNVVNHGDCWVNNMLFQYDAAGKPFKHIFVDFQLCKYGSPALDLLYFFGTSLADDMYFQKKDMLLKEYHETLTMTMKQLNCETKSPTIEDLKRCLKQRAFLEMISSFTVLPIILIDKEDVVSVDEMIEADGDFRNPGIKSKRYRETMSKRLPIFDQMGLFDLRP